MTTQFRLQDEAFEFTPKFAEEASFESEDEEKETQIFEVAPPAIPMSRAPLPIPPEGPIPFAPPPPMGSYWPVRTRHKNGRLVSYKASDGRTIVGSSGRMFLANRKTKRGNKVVPRWHVGVDLFANVGDVVVACENGTIVGFDFFYNSKSGQQTFRLLIEHSGVVVNYGEVTRDSLRKHGLKKGMPVKAGQPIAFVSDTSMLHFETYVKGTTQSHRWFKDEKKPPAQLLNPTKYLLFLQQNGLVGEITGQPAKTPAGEGLNRGSREYIRWVQHSLNQVMGLRLAEDGIMGTQTRSAIRSFQQRHGLTADGIVGSQTERALKAAGIVPSPQASSTSTPAAKQAAKVSDREVGAALAMAAKKVPSLGITLEELLLRHKADSGGIPIEVLLAFIHKEAGHRTFDDDTSGKWNERYQKYIPSFYELGVFQTPAGAHGCIREGGRKICKYEAPGYNVEGSQFGKGWYRLKGTYPAKDNWRDPTMQVRIGLWDLNSTGERIAKVFPALFPSRQSEWYLRMAILYSFSKGAGWTHAFLSKYKNELLALPESQRWNYLLGKQAYLKGHGTKTFDPENVNEKMALAAKLRAIRNTTN